MPDKLKKSTILTLFLLAIFIRLYNLDYPLTNQEVHVQHLISSHIVNFGEHLLVGSFNGTFPSLGKTPVYNYILSLPIFFYDSLMFVNLINLVLQVASIYILFELAKAIFDEKTAIVALIFMSFSSVLVTQAEWVWQPHLMFFLITLAFYFLYQTYKDGGLKHLLLSNFFFALSISVHMSSFSLIPIYLISIYLIYKNRKDGSKIPILSTVFLAGMVLFLYLPLIFHHNRFDTVATVSLNEKLVTSITQFAGNFITKLATFQKAVNFDTLSGLIMAFLLFFYFARSQRYKKEKTISLILFLTVISPIFAASFFNETFLPQHFTAIYGLFYILVSRLLLGIFYTKKASLKKLLVFLIIIFFTLNFSRNFEKLEPKPILKNFKTHKNITSSITNSVYEIEEDSFQFRLYTSDIVDKTPGDVWFFDTLFWPSLEREFKRRFTKTIQEPRGYWYEVTNTNENLIVGCFGYINGQEKCLEEFLEENEDFYIDKNLVKNQSRYSFYLAKGKK